MLGGSSPGSGTGPGAQTTTPNRGPSCAPASGLGSLRGSVSHGSSAVPQSRFGAVNMPYVIEVAVVAVVQVDIAPPLLTLSFLILSAWPT